VYKKVNNNTTVLTNRSFTNHEQINELNGLVHMQGRVYDSNIGRFTSADIHIPHPYSTQSFNRYAYVRNNPLGFVDPSGYTGVEVNAAQAIEHEVQKVKSAPEALRTEGDHTPAPNKVDQLARQQVMINNPQLFTNEAKGQTFMIDVSPSFFEEGIGYTLGSIVADGYAAYFNDGYNPLTNQVLSNQEILDAKVMGLFGFALPEVGFLRFGKGGVSLKVPNNLAKNIHMGQQGKHIEGHNNYLPGRSTLLKHIDSQKLLDSVHDGSNIIVDLGSRGNPIVDFGKPIGIDAKTRILTQYGQLHTGKKGVHIVPHILKNTER